MCAYCHSTNLQKNFDVAYGDVPHDVFRDRCELRDLPRTGERARGTGPEQVVVLGSQARVRTGSTQGRRHAAGDRHRAPRAIRGAACCMPISGRATRTTTTSTTSCWRRSTYYADGQIMDEDYEYGSFLQSKMYPQEHPLLRLPQSAFDSSEAGRQRGLHGLPSAPGGQVRHAGSSLPQVGLHRRLLCRMPHAGNDVHGSGSAARSQHPDSASRFERGPGDSQRLHALPL